MKKKLLNILVLAFAVFMLVACGEKQEEPAKKEEPKTEEPVKIEEPAKVEEAGTILIGVAGPQSGDLASYGIPTSYAAKLVVDKINANGGINGKQIVLLVEDDVCKPEVATNTATKLASQKVSFVIGHICSGATKAALSIYKDANIAVISPSATNPALTQSGEYPNFFRTIAPDDAQAKLEVEFAVNTLKAKKIAVLHDKGDYGKGLAEFAKTYIEQTEGVEVVFYEGVTPGAVDYSAVVQKLKRSEADAVIFGGYHPEASKIVSQMKKKKIEIPFISDDGVKDDTFIKVAGEYAEGVYATGPKDTSTNSLYIQAKEEHAAAYNAEPGAFFYNGYSAVMAVLNAMEKAGSTDTDAVMKALRSEYVETPLGNISFDEKGDAIGVGFSMYQVQNGQYVELK